MVRKNKRYHYQKRKSIFKRRWFWYAILVIFLMGGISYFLFKTSYFEIKNVEVAGEEEKIVEEVKKMIENKNFFLLSASMISTKISETFPQVKEVTIEKHFPDAVSAQILERQAAAIFCPQRESESCFLISKEGIIFNTSERKNDLILIFSSGLDELNLGKQVIEKALMEDIILLLQELNNSKIIIKEIEILPLEIKAKTEQGFFIYFSKSVPIKNQIEILLTTLQKTISNEEQKNLQYIDLRGLKENQRGIIYWQ